MVIHDASFGSEPHQHGSESCAAIAQDESESLDSPEPRSWFCCDYSQCSSLPKLVRSETPRSPILEPPATGPPLI